MSALRIKACGLKKIDNTSLRSMLTLANNLLTHNWEIIDHDQADLYIYSLETKEGKAAWLEHDKGFSAILSSQKVTESADIILKKPLRTKNFSETLNSIEDKIKFVKQGKKITRAKASSTTVQKSKTKQKDTAKSSLLFTSLSSGLSKHLVGIKSPAWNLPQLSLNLPIQNLIKPDTILDSGSLKKWLKELSKKDNTTMVSTILGNIIPLNRTAVPVRTRLSLLDLYQQSITQLLFSRDITSIKLERSSHSAYIKSMRALMLLVEELSIGYKIIIDEAYHQGERPDSNDFFLIAINRTAENISLSILLAYSYYRTPATTTINTLHQLYLYCEASNTLHKTVSIKGISTSKPFYHIYNQIILTSIADPFRLTKFEVFKLHTLMDDYADKTEISPLINKHKNVPSEFLMTGYFCIDTNSDYMPTALAQTSIEKRRSPQSRLLNTQPVVKAIGELFERAALPANKGMYDLDIKLLQQAIPQINTSYDRQFHRLPSSENHQINLANGITAIHDCLSNDNLEQTDKWIIHNQSSAGMMLSRNIDDCHQLNIGDFIGVFIPHMSPSLAITRWLCTDTQGTTEIGLEIYPGLPVAVTAQPKNGSEIIQGLLLPEDRDIRQPSYIIVEKGGYSTNRVLHITEGEKTYIISATSLIDNTFNYEQFRFKVHNGSQSTR
jgi:hypothetical protein